MIQTRPQSIKRPSGQWELSVAWTAVIQKRTPAHPGHTSTWKVYAHIGRKILSQVKQQRAPKLPRFLVCLMYILGAVQWSPRLFPTALVSIVQKPGDKGQNENMHSGQFPDTDAQTRWFEDVYSMCLLVRSLADPSPRKRFTTSLAPKVTLSNKRQHKW